MTHDLFAKPVRTFADHALEKWNPLIENDGIKVNEMDHTGLEIVRATLSGDVLTRRTHPSDVEIADFFAQSIAIEAQKFGGLDLIASRGGERC